VGLAPTTLARWRSSASGDDQRRGPHTRPANAFSEAERANVVELASLPEHVSMAPCALVLDVN
jgi:hypothetical protein